MHDHKLFGTSGIRGVADELFTSQFCFDIGRTFVEFLKQRKMLSPIAVGMDPRVSSPRIKRELFKGLSTSGMELFDEGVTPIPSMNWLIKNTPAKAGIMITGSHIAPDSNGVKFYAHNEEISVEDEKLIEQIYANLPKKEVPQNEPNVTIETKARELYKDLLLSLINPHLPKWKIAVDTANGAQSVLIPDLLLDLGQNVIKVNCDLEEPFIARDTDSEDKAGLDKLKALVAKEKCDFGIAYDGDGDRVVFIDENGKFIQGEYSCCLIAKRAKTDTIVTTIAASQVADHIGKKIIRTRVGSPYVVGAMKKYHSLFGFEQNGGAVSAEIQYSRDGGTTTVKVLNIFAEFKGTFSQLIATLPKFYMSRTKIDYPWKLQQTILDKAREHFKGIKVDKTDGVKIWLDDKTWMLFRSSQNAPEFRVFAESTSQKASDKMLAEGLNFVRGIIKENS